MTLWLQTAAIPLLIGLNAFFVAAEYAIVAIRGSQIEALRAAGARSARPLARLKADMSGAIGTIQICITLTNLLIGWVAEPAISDLLGLVLGDQPALRLVSLLLGFVVVTLLTVVLSELVPKSLTLQYTVAVARATAGPTLLLRRALAPLVWVMSASANAFTTLLGLGRVRIEDAAMDAEEIRHVAVEAGEAGELTPRERSLILNSLALGRRRAEQVMVPRLRVEHLDVRRPLGENLAAIGRHLFSRLPVCDGGLDKVLGVVHTKELLTAYSEYLATGGDAGSADPGLLLLLAREPVFAPAGVGLDGLLALIRERRASLVFLVDEHGGVRGIVTLSDVVDELIGHAPAAPPSAAKPTPIDEAVVTARLPGVATAGGDGGSGEARVVEGMVVDGDAPLHEVAGRLGRERWGESASVNTVGGLIVRRLGRIPAAGESVEADGVRLDVLVADARRVARVRVTPAGGQPVKPA